MGTGSTVLRAAAALAVAAALVAAFVSCPESAEVPQRVARTPDPAPSPGAATETAPESVLPGPSGASPAATRPRAALPAPAASEPEKEDPVDRDVRLTIRRPDGAPAAGASVSWSLDMPGLFRPEEYGIDAATARGDLVADASGEVRFRVRRWLGLDVTARLGRDAVVKTFDIFSEVEHDELTLVAGVVTELSGVVQTPDGAPVAGAMVLFVGTPAFGDRTTTSDARGRFGTVPFLAAEVVLSAERADLFPGQVQWKPGDPRAGIVLTQTPAVCVRGRVVDESGAPVAGTWLLLQNGGFGDERRLTSDERGAFAVRMHPVEKSDLLFYVKGYCGQRLPGVLVRAGDRDLGDVVVRRGGTIRGAVVLADGTPCARPRMTVESVLLGAAVGEGRFGERAAFEAGPIGPGEHRLHVTDDGPAGTCGAWAFAATGGVFAGNTEVRVVAPDGPGVLVRLRAPGDDVDAPPRRFPRARATLRAPGATDLLRNLDTSDVDTFRLAAAPGARCVVTVEADDCETWTSEPIVVPEGAAVAVDALLVRRTK